jgi:hypothetical protein
MLEINGPTTGGLDDKIKMSIILLKTNIPAFSPRRRLYEPEAPFHYSIFGTNSEAQKTYIFSMSCMNSETLLDGVDKEW